MADPRINILFVYFGKRGAMPRFTLELMEAAQDVENVNAFICISEQNEVRAHFDKFAPKLIAVTTFNSKLGFVLNAWRLIPIRRKLSAFIKSQRITHVVELMPHVWSFLIGPSFKRAGAEWISILHDANGHPGDNTALIKPILDLAIHRSDRIIVLSRAVGDRAVNVGLIKQNVITILFHPDIKYNTGNSYSLENAPLSVPRLLFFGRIMPYKGLGLFVSAMEILATRGIRIPFGVFGEGNIEDYRSRLELLGAEIQNNWLDDSEVNSILARHEIMIVSHTEASQSGVVATAFGAGMPVVATPVGALTEQVDDGITGLISAGINAEEIANTIEKLATNKPLLEKLRENVKARQGERSMQRFVRELVRTSVGQVRLL